MKKVIQFLFLLLFFLVPIILNPKTSEIFEFNKLVFAYISAILIVAFWLARMVFEKRVIFRRTALDIPLLLLLLSQTVATIFSIDPYTSIFGYYGRFHGGLLSTFAFAALYWAFVSNVEGSQKKYLKAILASGALVATYGLLQHFGIDESVWSQDVRSRVFSTLGQPNWLAAYLVALTPITWHFLSKKTKHSMQTGLHFLSAIFFLTILYTQSRSGLLGFLVAFAIYWGLVLRVNFKKRRKQFLISLLIPVILWFVVGTSRWTNSQLSTTDPVSTVATRKLVWTGAIKVWQQNPIFGTGPETFAYTYPRVRPAEHNLLSEWDYIYNKAHNEYLNYLANSGAFGLASYLLFICFALKLLRKNPTLLAGFASILVTDFFGFSVTPISVLFFLFPGIATLEEINEKEKGSKNRKLESFQSLILLTVILATFYALYKTYSYYRADLFYAEGRRLYAAGKMNEAAEELALAVKQTPGNPIFIGELSSTLATHAVQVGSFELANSAEGLINHALAISPKNTNIIREKANTYLKVAALDSTHYKNAQEALLVAIDSAPTDPKLWYNLGLVYIQTNQLTEAKQTLEHTIQLKPDYQIAKQVLTQISTE